MYKDGVDQGYLEMADQDWWLNPDHPNAFEYANLDQDYPAEYFPAAEVPEHVIEAYCKYIPKYYKATTLKDLETIVEFGSGGGWFLKRFLDHGYHAQGFEGSRPGYDACIARGISRIHISKRDFRYNLHPPESKFDIALCTEVGEHIPVTLHGVLVQNLIAFSDVIWFSSEAPNTNLPHVLHPGEVPDRCWIELFKFYGYAHIALPDHVRSECAERGKFIFYKQ